MTSFEPGTPGGWSERGWTSGADVDGLLRNLAEGLGLEQEASTAAETAILRGLDRNSAEWSDAADLAQTAAILEQSALLSYRDGLGRGARAEEQRQRAQLLFGQAYGCYRLLADLSLAGQDVQPADGEVIGQGLDLPFRMAISGLMGRKTADVRYALRLLIDRGEEVTVVAVGREPQSMSWDDRLLVDACGAILLLVRKADGWADVDRAMSALEGLRGLQAELEPSYLESALEARRGHDAALSLVALFHAAQIATISGGYLQKAGSALPSLYARLDRHRDHAQQALSGLDEGDQAPLMTLIDLLWVGAREVIRNSIWAHAEGLGDRIGEFVSTLASRGRPNPVLELWPSQQEALAASVLDQYRRAVLVQMPTSAGKTLLAQFLIVQSRALLPTSTVAYIVPTRALVNQVTRDLRRTLGQVGLEVEQAVPAYELDPTEDALLSENPAVLVTTPEKLSLLLRRNHPALEQLGLVVVDEAHNLADGERGARLELLLATIRRDRPGARYLLLSPFLPEADDLVEWLGDDRGLPPVSVNWRPGKRVLGAISVAGRRPSRSLEFRTLPAAGSVDVSPGHAVELASVSEEDLPGNKSIKATTRLAANALAARGSTLVLCWGPAYAMQRAGEIAEDRSELPSEPLRDAVARFVESELGDDSGLSAYIRRGVAYHHSGMSQEARLLVETLVSRNLVTTICGTTTLAQGVNFPISNVLIEDKRKGRDGQLGHSDLWNIIGRSGRALMDESGLVGFPIATSAQEAAWTEFLQDDAVAVASQLSSLIDIADGLSGQIGLREIRSNPVLTDMLQFLAHAMHVGGAEQTAAELEDLLRASLVYRQASDEPERVSSLVRLCRHYLEQVAGQPGLAALSDQTGFSTPSVGLLLASSREVPDLANPRQWEPDALFGVDQQPLVDRMRILGEVPELGLGWEAAGTFSPERVAKIVAAWVNGASVSELANEFGDAKKPVDRRIADFAKYLYGTVTYKTSWGLGALQSVHLSGSTDVLADAQARYVPSMVYFGVSSPEAVWMRMAGLPRLAARGAGDLWRDSVGQPPTSYRQLRGFLGDLDAATWQRAAPESRLTGEEMRLLWNEALG